VVAVNVILDAGALIAADRGSVRVQSWLELARRNNQTLRTPSPVVGRAWRDGTRQALLARLLKYVDVIPVDEDAARRAGELLATTGGSDVVDALVALTAGYGDTVLTSDPDDLRRLVEGTGHRVRVVAV
jgi:predicted nucleic acid-binding protein